MIHDIIIVIGFIIAVIVICKVWNLYTMKQYNKSKENRSSITYGFYVNSMEKTQIVGIGSDGNGDYDVSKAIKKIELPDDVRIKL